MQTTETRPTVIISPQTWRLLLPYANGWRRAELTIARKVHICLACSRPIVPEECYYAVTIPGAGLQSLKFPERLHVACLEGIQDGHPGVIA